MTDPAHPTPALTQTQIAQLLYWDDCADRYCPVPRAADTPALRELLDLDGVEDGGERVVRFRRAD